MRFEDILQIYWTKGFFYGGKLFYFNLTFNKLFTALPGLNNLMKKKLIARFELTNEVKTGDFLVNNLPNNTKTSLLRPLNIIFSQVNTVNNRPLDVIKLSIIRSYLIKSYRGRCHALGKPVRGQRTWSNAWNSYNLNKTLRFFISETSSILNKDLIKEKINYKVTKKKYITKKKKIKVKEKKKIFWF